MPEPDMEALIATPAAFAALILATLSLGGGIYETLLIDRAWPANVALIQPKRGGIDRKRFWMPAHFTFEAALALALWATWSVIPVRERLLAALGAHVVMRVWSFAYFVPLALKFEKAGELTPELDARARTWVQTSYLRLLLDAAVVASLCLALTALLRA